MTACSDISPYGSLRATLGTERTSASRPSARPHVPFVDFLFFLLSSHYRPDCNPPFKLRHKTTIRVLITTLPALAVSAPSSFLSPTPLVLRSQTNIYRHDHRCHAATVCSFISYFSLSLCSHFSLFYSVIDAPEAAATILS